MSRFFRLSTAAVAAVASLSLCASAPAAVVTVGSPLTQTFMPAAFSEVTTSINSIVPELGAHATSPVDGVIVRWRILEAAGGPFKLRVLRPAGGASFLGAGRSKPETPTGPGLQTFATNLPIKAGDTIGIDNADKTGDVLGLFFLPTPGGPVYSYFEPQIPEGIATAPKGSVAGFELAFNADVQPAPTITAIAPASGLTTGGTAVTISGTDFGGASAVSFGPTPALSVTVNSESSITAVAPPAAGPVSLPVSVTTIAGTAFSAQPFTYNTGCVVPKLVGKKLKASKKKLRRAACKIGTVTKKAGATGKTGKVTSQSPKPGRILAPGSAVKVTLKP